MLAYLFSALRRTYPISAVSARTTARARICEDCGILTDPRRFITVGPLETCISCYQRHYQSN